jgi:hypothetical protein
VGCILKAIHTKALQKQAGQADEQLFEDLAPNGDWNGQDEKALPEWQWPLQGIAIEQSSKEVVSDDFFSIPYFGAKGKSPG